MKRILYATGYSDNAKSALKYAISLSEKLNASLFVIHVFDYPTVFTKELKEPYENLEEKTFKIHHDKLAEFCKNNCDGDIDKLDISFDVIENKSIVNGIIEKANNLNADLIITGTKSEKLLKELILGNTAKHLIEKAPCPILTIPNGKKQEKIDTIVYASDFEENDIRAIFDLLNLVRPFNPTIKIVHISTKEDYKGDEQMNWFMDLLKERIVYDKIDAEIIFDEDIFNGLK
jgi:nucleotide-binding universal stress UspA family protein